MCSLLEPSASMAPVLLVVFLATAFHQTDTLQVCMTSGDARVGRSDVREVLRGQIDPSFWPTRGRRGGSSEESEPPFWANRGREFQSEEEQPPFWGNRGRTLDQDPDTHHHSRPPVEALLAVDRDPEALIPHIQKWFNVRKRQQRLASCCDTPFSANYSMYVEEPQHILLERRGGSEEKDDQFWVSRGRREATEKRESNLERLNREFSPLYEDAEEGPSVQKRSEPPPAPKVEDPNAEDAKFWKSLASTIGAKRARPSNASDAEPQQ
nr:PREDICTED: uncharacterized protein LOC109039214 isoform X1 [Bemisia tabaci]